MSDSIETFRLRGDSTRVSRRVLRRTGKYVSTSFSLNGLLNGNKPPRSRAALADLADAAFLRAKQRPKARPRRTPRIIRVVDLFSGCGAMSLGAQEAARALGYRFEAVLAIDINTEALSAYKINFPSAATEDTDIRCLVRARLSVPLTDKERAIRKKVGRIDLLLAGPPCQGHSDLNNRTRRSDPKNSLYHRVARFAKITRPNHLVIENVPAVLHDRGHVVSRTKRALEKLGYQVEDAIVRLLDLGIPQTRRRHVMVASMRRRVDLEDLSERYLRPARSVRWAIEDLSDIEIESAIDRAPAQTATMKRRIRYLFKHGLYDLPNHQRPLCHRNKNHTYKSVYGRLRWGRPAQTITSGFRCMGQGRFVHPKARRTLTPHEAARLQLIPDFFTFGNSKQTTILAEMIGNAVPPKLTYIVALELLR